MFVQTEITPNPNSLKFLPGKAVSPNESFEISKKDETNNEPYFCTVEKNEPWDKGNLSRKIMI